MSMGDEYALRKAALDELRRTVPTAGIYYNSSDKIDPIFDYERDAIKSGELIRKRDKLYDKEVKYFGAIVDMASESYGGGFDEEYNEIASQYIRNEISKEEFLEELSYLKMAIKLVEE